MRDVAAYPNNIFLLFLNTIIVDNLPFVVDEIEAKEVLACRADRETGIGTAILRAFRGFHLTRQRTR